MSEISITYDLLFDVLRVEKSREELQKLDNKFYQNVVEYLNNKESIINNPNTPNGERELTRIQLGNVKKILAELYERRERKIINLAIYKIKTHAGVINSEALLEEERYLFDALFVLLSKYRASTLNNVLEGRSTSVDTSIAFAGQSTSQNFSKKIEAETETSSEYENVDGIKSVRFIKPVPRFLGPELETYGPFEENDIASLPSKIAGILIRKNRAEEMTMQNN